MAEKKIWSSVVIPFECYRAATKGGALVFQIEEGKYKGYQFVRPAMLVRRSFEKGKPGFQLSYTVTQEIENDDVLFEESESITLRKSEKNSEGKYETVDEQEVYMSELEESMV